MFHVAQTKEGRDTLVVQVGGGLSRQWELPTFKSIYILTIQSPKNGSKKSPYVYVNNEKRTQLGGLGQRSWRR